MRADEPARILPPYLAIPKWCELHSRRYYQNRQDAHACDTFLTPPYMDKLASLVDRVRVCLYLCRCWSLFLSLSCVALSFLLSLAHSVRPPIFLSLSFLLSLSLSLPLVVLVCGFAYLACVDSKGLILLLMLGRRSGSAACRW